MALIIEKKQSALNATKSSATADIGKRATKAARSKATTVKAARGRAKSSASTKAVACSIRATSSPSPSVEDVALRAYYIAKERQQLGIPGDSLSDWVEAEKQLRISSR